MEEENDRLAQELTSLSTKLMTAVARSSEMESTLVHLRKDNNQLRSQLKGSQDYESLYQQLHEKHKGLEADFKETSRLKREAESENTKLQGEVEELTASLFNEANIMVSNASKETHNFKIKNRKLYEELEEKDTIISDLQDQLKDLKSLISSEDGKDKGARDSIGKGPSGNEEVLPESDLLFSPGLRAIRFDVAQYQYDFRAFVFALIKPTPFDLSTLKGLRFFRKIWTEELENSISNIPPVSSSNFINRFQKGKTFWNLLVEGRAIIEPVKGVNETFKLTYNGLGAPGTSSNASSPFASREPCAFCFEARNDVLEHSRLHTLKLLSPESVSADEVVMSYPLCNYCLIKLRNICDFFAKLRLIHANVYKLQPHNEFDEYAPATNFQFRRESVQDPVEISDDEETKLMKIYVMLAQIRAKIYWSKIGFWDLPAFTVEANLDDVASDQLVSLIWKKPPEKPETTETRDITEKTESSETVGAKSHPAEPDNESVKSVSSVVNVAVSLDQDDHDQFHDADGQTSDKEDVEQKQDQKLDQKLDQKQDQNQDQKQDQKQNQNQDQKQNQKQNQKQEQNQSQKGPKGPKGSDEKPKKGKGVQRKNSTSKRFKKKVNSGLEETMQMLEESIKE